MKKLFALFLLIQSVVMPSAGADINATLSRDTLNAGETLQLTYEVVGAPSNNPPDLSPLEKDFSIVQRSVRHSTRSFNGRTTQRSTLELTLMPRTSGSLRIPSLRFGAENSPALTVTVAAGANPLLADKQPGLPPEPPNLPLFPWQQPYGLPGWMPPAEMPGASYGSATPPTNPPPSTAATRTVSAESSNRWFWIAMIASVGWGLTALWLLRLMRLIRQRRGSAAPIAQPAPPTSAAAAPPVIDHVAAIRDAYQRDDPFAAKEALLAWAAVTWAGEPPTNLSRLAARCAPTLQRQVLKLEEAIYSPQHVTWNQEAVWRYLDQTLPAATASGQRPAAPS
jgi:hypothetical protein